MNKSALLQEIKRMKRESKMKDECIYGLNMQIDMLNSTVRQQEIVIDGLIAKKKEEK